MEFIDEELINENLSTADDPNIAQTDQNLSVDNIFQQTNIGSLAKEICSIAQLNGPSGAIFTIVRKGTGDIKLIRKEVEVFPSEILKTSVTREAIQDLKSQFGKDADLIIGTLFRGLSNDLENEKLLEVLSANAKDYGDLTLSDSLNASISAYELTQRIHEIVLKMNQTYQRSYESFCVLPAKSLSSFMGLSSYLGRIDKDSNGLFITQINKTKFYLNPDSADVYAYVGLKDENLSKSSLVLSPYQNQVFDAVSPDSGDVNYFLVNRFAITVSPLHELNDEILYKFKVI